MANKKIVFIHGLYMNGRSWAPWVEYASQRGYDAIAPSYPFHEGEPSFLRAHVEPAIGRLQFKDVLNTYKRYIDTLPERPILIGHSIGGLLVQKLVNDGYGSIGVAITPAPPTGIFSFSPTFFRANWRHVDPFAGNKPVIMTEKRFHYTFCNVQTRESSDVDFEKYVVPESRNIPRSTLTESLNTKSIQIGHTSSVIKKDGKRSRTIHLTGSSHTHDYWDSGSSCCAGVARSICSIYEKAWLQLWQRRHRALCRRTSLYDNLDPRRIPQSSQMGNQALSTLPSRQTLVTDEPS